MSSAFITCDRFSKLVRQDPEVISVQGTIENSQCRRPLHKPVFKQMGHETFPNMWILLHFQDETTPKQLRSYRTCRVSRCKHIVNPRIPGGLFAKMNFWVGAYTRGAYSRGGGLISKFSIFLKG